jgi:pimeloyl-ACP methyl ester carboxylesterase
MRFIVLALVAMTAFAQPDTKTARYSGGSVVYDNYGKGPRAVVLVHGWTCSKEFWKANTPALAASWRVIAIDLPGHGASDKPETKYSMEFFARSIDAVLRDAKVDRAVLVGHSMGTPVIRQFYRLYPEKAEALVVVDGSLRPFAPPEVMEEKVLKPMRADVAAFRARMLDGMLKPVADVNRREWIRAEMLKAPPYVAVSAFESMIDPSIWKDDPIKVPVLAIYAKQPTWSADYEQYVRRIVPRIDYQSWDGVSHFLMMDEPGKFNRAVLAFLGSLGK